MIIIFIGALLLTSCEDVINLPLKNASPQLVVQGSISNRTDTVKVILSKTTDYFNPGANTPVVNAQVNISDNAGHSYQLTGTANGIYYIIDTAGIPGRTYTLSVNTNGTVYTATSQMPELVTIDSLAIENTLDRQNENAIECFIKDPPDVANYYLVKVFRNDSLLNPNRIIISSDKYYDGKSTQFTFDAGRFGLDRFKPSDTLRVVLFNIDRPTYDYFNTLRDIINADSFLSTSTPANPTNNISDGALGYFAAWSVSEKTIIVK
jgi:hypothetical protein